MVGKRQTILSIIVLSILIIAIAFSLKLYLFSITYTPSAVIKVVDLSNNPIAGANVKIEETDDTWHWLGDIFNKYQMKNTREAGFDGVIDEYDLKYVAGYFGQVEIGWVDMNNDGEVDGLDIWFISKNVGLSRAGYPPNPENVTNKDGTVTFDIVYTLRNVNTYVLTVSKSQYSTKITTRELSISQTIFLEPLPQYSLTISSSAGGTTSPEPGIHYYTEGTVVSVSAIPNNGYQFLYWKLDGVINSNNPISVTMNTNHELNAYFEIIPPPPPEEYTLTISCTTGGITNPSPGTYTYTSGTAVLIVATADEGYQFTKWVVDGQDYSTQPSINLVMTKSYNVKAVFSLIPKPIVSVLTLLKFPPSTNVIVTLYAQSQETGKSMSGIGLTIMIMPKPEANYAGYTKGGVTGSDGTANIEILTPPSSKYSPYNMTVSYEGKIIAWFNLYVLPQLAVKVISFNYEQVYKPGDYDFIYTGSIVDKESMSEPISDFSAYSITLKDEKGTTIPFEYTSYSASASTFTFKAKVYDYYKSYAEHTLTLTIVFRKTGYIDGTLTATAKMVPPTVMAIVESSSVVIGKNTFTIVFRDKYGQPYAGLTEHNIEVIITDPNGISMSTANELKDKYYFNDVDKAITIVYTFDKVGPYKIVVKYSGLPFYQDPSTFTVTSSEAPSPIPSILTNPYVIGFIVLIILILIFRRRKR